jgi:hypothetical protein
LYLSQTRTEQHHITAALIFELSKGLAVADFADVAMSEFPEVGSPGPMRREAASSPPPSRLRSIAPSQTTSAGRMSPPGREGAFS